MIFAVVNFKGKLQDLNRVFVNKKDAFAYYNEVKAKYPHIHFAVWQNPQGGGHFEKDITPED